MLLPGAWRWRRTRRLLSCSLTWKQPAPTLPQLTSSAREWKQFLFLKIPCFYFCSPKSNLYVEKKKIVRTGQISVTLLRLLQLWEILLPPQHVDQCIKCLNGYILQMEAGLFIHYVGWMASAGLGCLLYSRVSVIYELANCLCPDCFSDQAIYCLQRSFPAQFLQHPSGALSHGQEEHCRWYYCRSIVSFCQIIEARLLRNGADWVNSWGCITEFKEASRWLSEHSRLSGHIRATQLLPSVSRVRREIKD